MDYDSLLFRLYAERKSIEEKTATIQKAIEAERGALDKMRNTSDKAIQKRIYFETELIAANQRYLAAVEGIEKKFEAKLDVIDTHETSISSSGSIYDDKLDAEIQSLETARDEKIEAIQTALNSDKEALEKEFQTKVEMMRKKLDHSLENLNATAEMKIEGLRKKTDLAITAAEARKGVKNAKNNLKAKSVEVTRKVKEQQREAALAKEKNKLETYTLYLNNQLAALGGEPLSNRLATLEEQLKGAQADMEENRKSIAIAMFDRDSEFR